MFIFFAPSEDSLRAEQNKHNLGDNGLDKPVYVVINFNICLPKERGGEQDKDCDARHGGDHCVQEESLA